MKYIISNVDNNQVARLTYDENSQAQRVIITGDFGISEAVKDALKDVKIEASTQIDPITIQGPERIIIQKEYEKIEIPVIVKEYEKIEVPVHLIQTEYEIQTIETPVYITKYEKIEVPVVIREKEIVYVDKFNMKMFYIMQAITLALIVLAKFLK